MPCNSSGRRWLADLAREGRTEAAARAKSGRQPLSVLL